MRLTCIAAALAITSGGCATAARHWQVGTWTDLGIRRTPWVGAPPSSVGPLTPTSGRPVLTEVATYVIETADLRLDLEDIVPIGGSFDRSVSIGATVTFALRKATAFIRQADGTEYRLRIVRKRARLPPPAP